MIPTMTEPPVFALIAFDGLSAILCILLAVFFVRAHRMFPERGYGVLGLAFGVWTFGYSTVAVSAFHLAAATPFFDAVRAGTLFLGSVLIFLNYAARRARLKPRTLQVAAAALALATVVYLSLYVLAPDALVGSHPLDHLPWLRLLGAFLLLAAAFVIVPDIPKGNLAQYRVPLALTLLAFERYTVAFINFYGQGEDILLSYPWRIAGLALLVRVAWPPRRKHDAPA